VSQAEDGVWDVIDGLQRLSTIFEFVGVYRNDEGKIIPGSKLLETDYLPSLKDKKWDDNEDPNNSFTQAQRLIVKRAKIDMKIIKRESDPTTKYELFQRLNTLGSRLSDQEVRNCLLVLVNRDFYKWLADVSSLPDFQNCISLSERFIEERYDQELVMRFLAFKNAEEFTFNDVGEYLNKKALEFAEDKKFDFEKEKDIFEKTFKIINRALDERAFKKYDHAKEKSTGAFLISAFETIAIGIGANIDDLSKMKDEDLIPSVIEKSKNIWLNPDFTEFIGGGVTASRRMPNTVPLGKQLFAV
jgi:hypothetical protein